MNSAANHGGDPDAQAMLIGSLRSQIQDLFSQVTQLNNKLVQSYDRVSDLEDNLHVASSNVRQSSVKISQLELERTQHLAALNTGLLVEKSHVTAELTRLMEKATEEAAQRGQAETARADIEKDLDDLSATLFHQANTMVAEARFARAQSERKVEDAEEALKGAEEAVGIMQQQMQEMQAEKDRSVQSADHMRALMGKGKWVERINDASSPLVRLRSSHAPYQEFLLFVAHLRSIRPSSTSPPAMSTLLPLPFLVRLLNEDSEPTVRLDLAPSLNWLSRRSVLSAIHTGQLTIEPMSSTNLLQESASVQTFNMNTSICCALCGTPVFQNDGGSQSHYLRPPPHPLSRAGSSINSISRSANLLFKNPRSYSYSVTNSASNSPPVSPRQSQYGSPAPQPQQIYIFRLASTSSSTSNLGVGMLPMSMSASYSSSFTSAFSQHSRQPSQTSTLQQTRKSQSTIYPLCTSGWCLTRLRSTCSLWAFIRTGVIEKVWEEEMPVLSLPSPVSDKSSRTDSGGWGKPPIPPRRGGLWGMASALGERATGWSEGDKEKGPNTPDKELDRKLPSPPPAHPASPTAPSRNPVRRLPPPLPKRAEGHARTRSATISRVAPPSSPPNPAAAAVEEEQELTPVVNGRTSADDARTPSIEQAEEDAALAPTEAKSNEAQETTSESTASPLPSDGELSPSVANKSGPDSDLTSPMSSPTTDKRNSQDSFASAASEITPLEVTPPPDPEHATAQETVIPPPSSSTLSLDPPPTPTQANASSSDAAPSAPVLHNEVSKEVPSRTGSPAPPPLPRRAAARARPSSMLPSASPPAPAVENATETVSNEKIATSDTLAVPNGEAATKESIADPPAAAPESTEPLDEANETPSESAQPVAEDASEGKEVVEKEVVEEPTMFHAIDGDDGTDAERLSTPSPTDEKLSEVPSSPTDTIIGNHVNGRLSVATVAGSSQAGDDADGEVYVGDATWEERTWKELVKLKEDMFWARIGGLR